MFSTLFASFGYRLRTQPYWRAIGYMIISTTAFSAMSASVRLVSSELHVTVIMVMRNVLTIALLLPWLIHQGRAAIATSRLSTHAVRGIIGGVGLGTWTYALTLMPLTHATALSFTAPLFSTLFAILFFREKSDMARWLALLFGFSGVLITLHPSMDGFHWASLIVIFATCSWAVTGMFVKSLSSTEPPLRMVFYMNLFMLVVSLPFSIGHWSMPSTYAWGVLVGMGICSVIMHFSMARAYSLTPVGTLMPFDFTRLITTAILAYWLFGETSDAQAWFGATIIIASAVFMARRDAKAQANILE
jgi:drug/metabolite transporter (DMT)-like permease